MRHDFSAMPTPNACYQCARAEGSDTATLVNRSSTIRSASLSMREVGVTGATLMMTAPLLIGWILAIR